MVANQAIGVPRRECNAVQAQGSVALCELSIFVHSLLGTRPEDGLGTPCCVYHDLTSIKSIHDYAGVLTGRGELACYGEIVCPTAWLASKRPCTRALHTEMKIRSIAIP